MERPESDPAQDKRVLLAVVLSIVVLWVFSYFAPKPPPRPALGDDDSASPADGDGLAAADDDDSARRGSDDDDSARKGSDDDDSARGPEDSGEPVAATAPEAPVIESTVAWEGISTEWSSRGGSPTSIQVSGYQEAYEQQWIPTWLISGFKNSFEWKPFTLACPEGNTVNIIKDQEGVLLPVGVDERGIAADTSVYEVITSDPGKKLEYRSRHGKLEVTKSYTLPSEGYLVDYVVRFRNRGNASRQVTPSFGVSDRIVEGLGGYYGPQTEAWADVEGDVEHFGADKLDKEDREFEGTVSWLGFGDRYYLVGLEPEERVSGQLLMTKLAGEDRYASELVLPSITIEPDESRVYRFKLWLGPKDLDEFQAKDLRLETAVEFGFFGVLSLPILAFLKFLQGLIGSWGLSIIALTICIKLLLFPLSQKAYKSMKAMQALQPELNVLKEKHGDDKEALNREMMALWKDNGVNPMGGCLPMFIQMPIWFALYRVLWNSVELYQQEFLYFCDLTLRDPLGVFPLVLGVTMWAQQKFTPNTSTDPTQKMVMKLMPIFFSVIMFTLPAGLVVYILVNNILSIGQQWVIHRQHGGTDAAKKRASSAGSGTDGSGKK